MSIIAWIVVGLLAGWIANMIMGGGGSLIADLLLGIVGAIVGGFIAGLLLGGDYVTGINFTTIIVSIIGAIIVVAIYRAVTGQAVRS
ncbi:MAG TPA: GlsB/YeaQ/YmgE family stress response membrane protein [Chloroflexia bacterium]|nr:GlsB/YeaQ/YmgE family stress response membrane protein [Chloroflexia bacterium]